MSQKRHRRDETAFTIIEVIAALLLVGTLSALLIPRMVSTGAGLLAEAELMRANLRYAQTLAMTGNTAIWSVQIDAQAYQLLRNGEPSPMGFPIGAGTVRHMNPGVQVASGTGTLVFDTMGAPASTHTITLSDGNRVQTVIITGFTGLIP